MREEPGDARLRSRMLAAVWASCTLYLSWHAGGDVAGGDSGEIGGAAFALGVAHPTGFAVDMLLLRGFTLLPLGSLAWRENFAVACVAAGIATLLGRLAWQLSRQLGVVHARSKLLGLGITVCALLGSRTFLASAVAVEVYATSLLFLTCAATLATTEAHGGRACLWPLFGLALAAHVTAPLLIMPLLAADAYAQRSTLCARPGQSLRLRISACAVGALAVAYLPLASMRDGPFDWGDPETLLGLWRHVSGARIREAFSASMFQMRGAPATALFAQLSEQPGVCGTALIGAFVLLRKQRAVGLTLLVVFCFDLAYGVWLNPMGIAERQVGHASAAVLALLAGLACAWLFEHAQQRARWFSNAALSIGALLCFGVVARSYRPVYDDGFVVAERYGSGSSLLDLAPHAVYVCSTDNACASALFALYAEGVRPDLDVVPAQHLWDKTLLRRMAKLSLPAPSTALDSPHARSELARRRIEALVRSCQRRPVYWELLPQELSLTDARFEARHVPWLGNALCRGATPQAAAAPSEQLAALEHARFSSGGPRTALARELWASAHAELGKWYLQRDELAPALIALQRTVTLTPERAVAHSNLGVALERQGDLAGALRETRMALERDPTRATAWANLARLMLRTSGAAAARDVLQAAERSGVRDPRLDQLRHALVGHQGSTE